jgi:predicted DNA-binding protein
MRARKKKDIGNPLATRFPTEMESRIKKVAERLSNSFSGAVIYLIELGLEEDMAKQEDEHIGHEIRKAKERKKASSK